MHTSAALLNPCKVWSSSSDRYTFTPENSHSMHKRSAAVGVFAYSDQVQRGQVETHTFLSEFIPSLRVYTTRGGKHLESPSKTSHFLGFTLAFTAHLRLVHSFLPGRQSCLRVPSHPKRYDTKRHCLYTTQCLIPIYININLRDQQISTAWHHHYHANSTHYDYKSYMPVCLRSMFVNSYVDAVTVWIATDPVI